MSEELLVGLRWYTLVVDAADPDGLARFWAAVLNWTVAYEGPDDVAIEAPEDADDRIPAIVFVRSRAARSGKNRLHVDLDPDDQLAEVERLVALGARPVDVGQSDVPWIVLADPEGNEFCVLAPRPPG